MSAKHSLFRGLVLLSYFGLLVTIGYSSLAFGPDSLAARLVLWTLISSGLLLVAPGIAHDKRRSYIWLCFILLIYFVGYVQALFSGAQVPVTEGEALASQQLSASSVAAHEVIAMVLVVSGFIASMLASRSAKR